MNRTPLLELTAQAGARYFEAAGFMVPADFGDSANEYRRALESGVVFDISHHGKLEVTGPEAPQFLHNLCTNDVAGLPLGGGCEAYFCDRRARALAHALIYHVLVDGSRHAFWLDVAPGHAESLLKHLDRHLIAEQVEMSDLTGQFAQVHVAGPKAAEILSRAVGGPIPDLAEFLHMERTVGGAACHIRRRDPLGIPGYDLVCANAAAGNVWSLLIEAGAFPAGLNAWEVLRIEAGTPIFGVDVGEDRFVMEVPRPLRAVSYSKGCYLGQEPIVMARDRAGFVNRTLLGIKVLGSVLLPPGAKLLREGAEVGVVTSCTLSPRLGTPLALAYIRRGHQEPGTRLEADGHTAAEVLPFPPLSGL